MYEINLSERQLMVYREALEFYSRFLAGQLNYLPMCLFGRHDVSEAMQKFVKPLLFPDLRENESYGIGITKDPLSEERQIAYEMYREVFVFQQKGNPGWDCYKSDTLKYSNEPLPIVIERS
jgi:hypothetical protein